jgi:hypothetical protein
MTTTASLWMNPTKLPDGQPGLHAISANLLLSNRGMWAMADDSGNFPQDTDDGVLWLDFSRDLMAGAPARGDRPGNSPGIPLLNPTGSQCRAVTDTCTLLVLSVKFAWRINVLGTIMQASEV